MAATEVLTCDVMPDDPRFAPRSRHVMVRLADGGAREVELRCAGEVVSL